MKKTAIAIVVENSGHRVGSSAPFAYCSVAAKNTRNDKIQPSVSPIHRQKVL